MKVTWITVLLNPVTQEATTCEAIWDYGAPRIFEGHHRNVALVTRQWQEDEIQRAISTYRR